DERLDHVVVPRSGSRVEDEGRRTLAIRRDQRVGELALRAAEGSPGARRPRPRDESRGVQDGRKDDEEADERRAEPSPFGGNAIEKEPGTERGEDEEERRGGRDS